MSMLKNTFENHNDTKKDNTDDAVKLNIRKAQKNDVKYKEIVKSRKFL